MLGNSKLESYISVDPTIVKVQRLILQHQTAASLLQLQSCNISIFLYLPQNLQIRGKFLQTCPKLHPRTQLFLEATLLSELSSKSSVSLSSDSSATEMHDNAFSLAAYTACFSRFFHSLVLLTNEKIFKDGSR